jgi:arylsulfatase
MKPTAATVTCTLALASLSADLNGMPPGSRPDDDKRPNIIFILADDLGYGELGCYGQQRIETPNIDALAASGMRFTQHYAGAPVCAPSRCALLTGKHTGHAAIRGNDEWDDRGDVWNYQAMLADPTLEGQRPMPEDEVTIARLLQDAGYATALVGKWGLGAPHSNSTPLHKGFDLFYGYNCQRQAHTYYPAHLYRNDQRVHLANPIVAPNTGLAAGDDPQAADSYRNYTLLEYAPDLMFTELTGFVDENRSRPFFLYWATPIPHMPIQAPQRWVDYYVQKFGEEEPYLGDRRYYPHRYPHAGYAAMITYLDEQVGLLVQQLKDLGIHENTLIIFTSDNGPTHNGGTDSPWFNSGGPFKCEQGWGKGYLHEGGIRVPMIASWPAEIAKETTSHLVSAFWDVLPTLCDIAGIATPAATDGISFLPELTGKEQATHAYLYWEFPVYGGQQAVRLGNWKGIRKNIRKDNLRIELYDLEHDLREQTDVAAEHPEIVRRMEDIMRTARHPPVYDKFRMRQLGD